MPHWAQQPQRSHKHFAVIGFGPSCPLKFLSAYIGYGQRDVANALKRFLTSQFVKFFFLIGPLNASKHLWRNFDHSHTTVHTVAQLPVDTFDVSVGQNGIGMREISKLPSVAMVTT